MEKKSKYKWVTEILNYVGTIGAVIMSIAYIIIVWVLIKGFEVQRVQTITVFAGVNAGVGFIILQFLKVQGQTLAEMDEENKKVIDAYHSTKTKDKKNHSMKFFWTTTVVKDLFVKAIPFGLMALGVIYIVIKGSGDYSLLGLAVVNLLMFICFGLLGLSKAYNYVYRTYIPYIKEQMKASTDEESEKEKNECLNLETKNGETYKNKFSETSSIFSSSDKVVQDTNQFQDLKDHKVNEESKDQKDLKETVFTE